MNKTKLKAYAPKARKDFIAAVTARANLLGLSDHDGKLEVAVGERKGDIAIIAGREWPVKVYSQREDLIKRMKNEGFNHTVEAVAYTWFNRFAALRYMEIHDYLDHGHRALSNREGGMPEILNHAAVLNLPGLNKAKAIELKLAGNKDNDLYKLILVAQCNALSNAMPFLFERIDDETELLLPDNLLLTDSVIAKLVADIPEEDWQEVEIIGWLYQFYISEKKNEVMGNVVKSEDIPAATQLFTPNWIVQYLVQNSIGRLWMMANPSSILKSQWTYYIEPAEQTPEVQAQLNDLIQTRMDEDGGSLNPETITVLDPACGSGHILVVAYDILKTIYLERGYQLRTIPRLILEKNLYGIDIDDRAAQMAGFALLMKARADDRRLFDSPPKLNVLSLQESRGINIDELMNHLESYGVKRSTAVEIIDTFAHAKTFGSLIQIPNQLKKDLIATELCLNNAIESGDLFAKELATTVLVLIDQSKLLSMLFDAVIANPPYMGRKYVTPLLKTSLKQRFPDAWSDLFSVFVERGFDWCKPTGFNSMVTMQSWMFLSSFEDMRQKLLATRTISCLIQIGYNSFPELNSKVAQACAFSIFAKHVSDFRGSYMSLDTESQSADKNQIFLKKKNELIYLANQDEFRKIPGSPIAYWIDESLRKAFEEEKISEKSTIFQGMITGSNDKFVRSWYELDYNKLELNAKFINNINTAVKYWVPYNKGGESIRWYGNQEFVVNFINLGRDFTRGKHQFSDYYFKECFSWSYISINPAARYFPEGFIWDVSGSSCFPAKTDDIYFFMALVGSYVGRYILQIINPTLNFQVENIAALPVVNVGDEYYQVVVQAAKQCINYAKIDWDNKEISWDYKSHHFINCSERNICDIFTSKKQSQLESIKATQKLESEINRILVGAYALDGEISPTFPEDQVTLSCVDAEKDSQNLISYCIGCMMGRYSLDEPGLIYAHAENVGFDSSRYKSFPADTDGILPITEALWFEDDAANRISEFMKAVWGAETLDENISWLAKSLTNKGDETSDETIRRYLAGSFYKNHLQSYKKRPIYWLFSSGKQGAFQALVYLHRYNEGTIARMRSEYVVPLTGKMLSRIEMLEKDAESAASTATRTKISKEIEVLRKQHIELLAYDEKLRHYADMRIQLDLDDGVKVNYGKFGDLLAEVKAVTGGADE